MNGISLRTAPGQPASLKADTGAALPTRVKVLNWGVNQTSEGAVIVDEITARVFAANQKAIGRERVALDYEHNTVPGTPEYERTTEPRAIGGNCALVCVPGEGIFGEAVTYTASGLKAAPDYEDLSLAPYLDKENRVIAAHSVALTRTGATYGINFKPADVTKLSAAESAILGELKTLSANLNPQEKTMSEKFVSVLALAGLVGLSAADDESAVMAKLKARLDQPVVDLAPLNASIATLTSRCADLEKKITAGESAAINAERTRLVTLFAAEGRIPLDEDGKAFTAEALGKMDVPTLRLLLKNTAVTVPLSARTAALEGGKSFKDAKGNVDLAAMFEEENSRNPMPV